MSATLFAGIYFNNRKIRREIKKDNEIKLEKKANLSLVKELDKKHGDDIKEVKLSLIGNSDQHKQLFDKVNSVAQCVARIEGYLNAKKEK
jgi:hypothetical protein